MTTKLLIIGGSDAGISAALRARELDPSVRVTVALSDRYPNFSICGLPFLISGEVADWKSLAHRTAADIEGAGISLLLEHTATVLDPDRREVTFAGRDGSPRKLGYDKLVVGTGAESLRPPIEGLDHPGVFFLRWMDDAFALKTFLEEKQPRRAVIVGAGYIGLEMADALIRRGLEVEVVEYAPEVLSTLDPELGRIVRRELEARGVKVATGIEVSRIDREGEELTVRGGEGFSAGAGLVLVAAGARPRTEPARSAGAETGMEGALKVDRMMRTSLPDVYAAGDCVETWHRLLERYDYLPLGTTAHKQGRVAGENALGGNREFAGSLGTQAVKVFGLVAARTGLRDTEAKAAGFRPRTAEIEADDHKAYYPGSEKLTIRLTGDLESKRLLGLQIVGSAKSEISKRVDIAAAALYNNLRVDELNDLDLSYTPPLSSPWDPVQTAAQSWLRPDAGRP